MRRRGWARHGASRDEAERLGALEDAVERLRLAADAGTVVVEGARDAQALEWLGIGGRHVRLHRGHPLDAVIEELAGAAPPVVLLLDWDRTGGILAHRLEESLRARVALDVECRRRLAACCHTRFLEEVPAELSALRGAVR
ncbi:MAG: toprim domain-containing protein [Thermoplasmatota archaeon]